MPYSIDRKNKCVYKKKPDGSRGKKVGCTKGPLKKYLAALYVNEQGCCKEMKLSNIYNLVVEQQSIFKKLNNEEYDFLKKWSDNHRTNPVLRKMMSGEELKLANILVKKGFMEKGKSDDKTSSVQYYIDSYYQSKLD